MKRSKFRYLALFLVLGLGTKNIYAQQGLGTDKPSKASVLELSSDAKGLLIPRVALKSTSNFEPIKGALGNDVKSSNSLIVYNTANVSDVTPGFYYWTVANLKWNRLISNNDLALDLVGDVNGTLANNTISKIQGQPVTFTGATNGQVISWNGSSWIPTSVIAENISGRKNLTPADQSIVVNNGTGATLIDANIKVADLGITSVKLANNSVTSDKIANDAVTIDKIANAGNNQVLSTDASGNPTWVDKLTLVPISTNVLNSSINTLTSTVNGISSNAPIVNTISNSVSGTNLTTSVNGISSSYDLKTAIQSGQKSDSFTGSIPVSVSSGTNINASGGKDYIIGVNTANGTSLGVVKQASTTPTVNVASDGALSVNASNLSLDGLGLIKNTTSGNLNVQARNGINVGTDDFVKLGGNLTEETTLTNNGKTLTIATGGTPTKITGLLNTSESDYNGTNGVTSDKIVSVGTDGLLKQLKAAMPKFFYMPSFVLPTAPDQIIPQSYVSYSNLVYTVDLYQIYTAQFGGQFPIGSSGSGKVSNSNKTTALPVLKSTEFDYYITYFDTSVYTNVSVSDNGVLKYSISKDADVTMGSFMNIVFAVKP